MACITEPFIDCESISLSYDASGLVNISMTVYSNDTVLPGNANISLNINGVQFVGFIISHSLQPVTNVPLEAIECDDPYYQHDVTIQSVT